MLHLVQEFKTNITTKKKGTKLEEEVISDITNDSSA